MKVRELKSIAQSVADMATSSRIHEDLSELVESEKGRIEMCLFSEDKSLPNLHKQLMNWWQAQVAKLPVVEIESITIDLEYDCSSVLSNRDKTALFDLSATCSIVSAVRTFTANSKNRIWWQARA